jgi:hypothetical protein
LSARVSPSTQCGVNEKRGRQLMELDSGCEHSS